FIIIIVLTRLMKVYVKLLIRNKQFKITANNAYYRALLVNGGRIGIGLFKPVASVLIFITAIENGIRALMIRLQLRKSNYKINDNLKDINLKELAKKYKDFPLFRAPQVFIDQLSQNMPILLLAT